MWPYTMNEMAFINAGAGVLCNNQKDKPMSNDINSLVEQYKKNVSLFINYIPNADAKNLVNKIVDLQVDLTKFTTSVMADTFKTMKPVK